MAEHKNHHYVPEFYFRLFNGDKRFISALLTKDGTIVPSAPIKGQCARNMFYGSVELEKTFSQIEGDHAKLLHALVAVATTGDRTHWRNDYFPSLLQAIVFQRSRTMLEVEKESPAMMGMVLHVFKEYVRQSHPGEEADRIIGAIDRGEVTITESPTSTVCRQIKVAFESATLLSDLLPRVIRNHTDLPFVFSDSPVVFFNSYYRQITNRGVLGLQTPGLQIFLPLTPKFQIMLLPPDVYSGSWKTGQFCEVWDRKDVDQLNALQLHHSHQAVYFASTDDAEYLRGLYAKHKAFMKRPEAVFRVRDDLLVRGERVEDGLMHTFEPQLDHDLSLSFITCTPIAPREYVFRFRTPELVEAHRRLLAGEDGAEA